MIICNYDRTWLGCSISMYMCNRVMMICLQVHTPSSKPASLCENHYQHKSFPGENHGFPQLCYFGTSVSSPKPSRRVPNGPRRRDGSAAAPGSGVVQRSAARRDGSRCGDLEFFWWDRYPLVMTNIAIENGDLFSGFTHWTWWFSIVILVYQRVNLI